MPNRLCRSLIASVAFLILGACAPRVLDVRPTEGMPGTMVSVAMEYLVGWPRVEIAGRIMEWPELKLVGLKPESRGVAGEDLTWIEDKVLQFSIPDLPPGRYQVTIHDDKGPPGQPVYSFLETAAYLAFPPVWPFVLRSNRAQIDIQILPASIP